MSKDIVWDDESPAVVWDDEAPKDDTIIEWDDGTKTKSIKTAPAVEPDPLPAKEPLVGPVGGVISGMDQGVTFGLQDEIGGAVAAGKNRVRAALEALGLKDRERNAEGEELQAPSMGEAYRAVRDSSRIGENLIKEASPKAYIGGEIVGDMAAQTGLALLTAGASLNPVAQTGIGAVSGFGRSDADATKGEVGKLALDTGLGAGISGALTLGGNKFSSWLQGRAAKGIEKAVGDSAEKAKESIKKNIESLFGKYRQAKQAGFRDLENVGREGSKVSPELQKAIQELEELGAAELRESVVENSAKEIPDQLAKIKALKQLYEDAVANKVDDVAKAQKEILSGAVKQQIAPRVKKYLGRSVIPAVTTGVGGAIAGPPGAIAGSLVGQALASGMGAPGTAFANAMKSPSVRKLAWEGVNAAGAIPRVLGQGAASAQRTLLSPEDQARLIEWLKSKNQDEGSEP